MFTNVFRDKTPTFESEWSRVVDENPQLKSDKFSYLLFN